MAAMQVKIKVSLLDSIKMILIERKHPHKVDDFWNDMQIDHDHVDVADELAQFCREYSWKHLIGMKSNG